MSKATGVSTSAINYYVRIGLLPPPVKTHKNMAYYDPTYIQMINYIKRLQFQKHLPLEEIKGIMAKKITVWRGLESGSGVKAEEIFTGNAHVDSTSAKDARRRIMQAGMRVFSRYGYFAAKEEDIIDEAVVPVGEFYDYYSGKEELLLDVAEEGVRIFRKKVTREISDEPDMLERISKAIPIAFQLIVENREIYTLYMEESVLADVTYEQKLRKFTATIVEDLKGTLSRGIKEGSIRRVKPDIAANAIMGQLVRLANFWVENPMRHDMKDITREAVEFVTRALCP
ncbi:MAG: MerR family transcriptional regulator [Actinomycetota bacterium]|nr:MerR family transcriptional regulator [Actinomycetota bacterium]